MYKIKLSPYAKTFYVEWLLDKTNHRYNLTADRKLYGNFDPERLRRAVIRYVSDHVVLNSHVFEQDGEYYWVRNESIVEPSYHDTPCDSSVLLNFVTEGFDLHFGPLYRFKLIRLGAQEYRLFVVYHHLVIDGSSMDQGLFDTLSHYYNDSNYVAPHSVEEQISLLTDFSETMSARLKENGPMHREFWRRQLSGVEGVDLTFLTSNLNAHGIGKSSSVGEMRFSFSQPVIAKLNQIKRKYKITPFIFGQCVFALLLYRFTNQFKIAFCYPVSIKEGVDFIYGAQVNANLIPFEFNQSTTILNLFEQARNFFVTSKAKNVNHAYYPVSEVLNQLRAGMKRLLDVGFFQTNLRDSIYHFDGIVKIDVLHEFNIDIISPILESDLAGSLYFEQELKIDQLNYRVRYDKTLIDEKLLLNFVETYKRLFCSTVDDITNDLPAIPISKQEILAPDQFRKIIYEWNLTEKEFPKLSTIHQLFEQQASKTPENVALIYNDAHFSYHQINQRANQLAHHINEQWNLKPDDIVALYLDRSEYLLIAVLGVLKAGAAYSPIDTNYPDSRVQFLLDDAEAKLVITDRTNCLGLTNAMQLRASSNAEILCIDNEYYQQKLANYSHENLISTATSRNLAYVIHTSGTTGTPKGVMIEHRSVVNRIMWMNKTCPLSAADRVLQKTPYTFDVSVWELFWANWFGATVVMAKPNGHTDPDYLIDTINQYRVSTVQFIPTMLVMFEEVLARRTQDLVSNMLPSLRYLISGGEALDVETARRVHRLLPSVQIHNLYGPTEATIDVLGYHCTAQTDLDAVYIGKPIDNTEIYILDDNLNPMPVGAAGQIYIGGVGLARGYLNKPELNLEKFIANPFQNKENKKLSDKSRLYKTGDKARWMLDGNIDYIGRFDNQVKLRGYRIELGEIETVLNRYPKIKQSAVILKRSETDNVASYLAAYCVLSTVSGEGDINSYVQDWQATYQEAYKNLADSTDINDFTGWRDSYTGQRIPKEQMEQWLLHAIRQIKNLNPCNVLEIGSGSGLMLFNLINDCQHYFASDISDKAITYLQTRIQKEGLADKVTLFTAMADGIPYNEITLPIDTVVINSVAQYFPSVSYLESLLDNLVTNLPALSAVFLGDIRNFDLLDVFYDSVLRQKFATATPRDIEALKRREKELNLSPGFFIKFAAANSRFDYVEILVKECDCANELTQFRFDVILYIDNDKRPKTIALDNKQFEMQADLQSFLARNGDLDVVVAKYVNRNVVECSRDLLTLSNSIDGRHSIPPARLLLGMGEINKLAQQFKYQARFYLDLADSTNLNIVFFRSGSVAPRFNIHYDVVVPHTTHNNPLDAVRMIDVSETDQIRSFLRQRLPSYMVPDVLIPMREFPLTINGKLDRDALPDTEWMIVDGFVEPGNELERIVCRSFAETLALPAAKVGVNHDFFKLGGNSLLAIRLAAKLQQHLKIDVADVFRLRTPHLIVLHAVPVSDHLRKNLDAIKYAYANCTHPLVINNSLRGDAAQQIKHREYIGHSQEINFVQRKKSIRAVLLTGATGHLGCNLLHQLLLNTDYSIYLPVRAHSDDGAFARLKDKFLYYFDVDLTDFKKRIFPFSADLCYSHFNLSLSKYQNLANEVDSIIHCAALTRHHGHEDEFHRANVQSTLNLLELAKQTVGKDFHYMSTVAVLLNGQITGSNFYIFNESDDADNVFGRKSNYAHTKFLGEQLVRNYRQYGVTSNIYRLGNLAMHSQSFRHQQNIEDNAFVTCLKAIRSLRVICNEIAHIEISPVDQSALAIVKLFDQAELININYHLFNPHLFDLTEFFASKPDWHVKPVELPEFIDRALSNLERDVDRIGIELFMLHHSWLHEQQGNQSIEIKVAQERTLIILNKLGFQWPKVSNDMLQSTLGNTVIAADEHTEVLGGKSVKPSAFSTLAKNERFSDRAEPLDFSDDSISPGSADERIIEESVANSHEGLSEVFLPKIESVKS